METEFRYNNGFHKQKKWCKGKNTVSDKQKFWFHQIRKKEENWFTSNLKNCVHQQKKAPNKSTRFLINRKSVSTSQDEGFLEKCDFTEPKSYFYSNQYLKKKKERKRFLLAETRFLKNNDLPLIAIMVSKKCEWKNIVSTKKKIRCH